MITHTARVYSCAGLLHLAELKAFFPGPSAPPVYDHTYCTAAVLYCSCTVLQLYCTAAVLYVKV